MYTVMGFAAILRTDSTILLFGNGGFLSLRFVQNWQSFWELCFCGTGSHFECHGSAGLTVLLKVSWFCRTGSPF